MLFRKGMIFSILMLTFTTILFPTTAFAIRVAETETPYPTFLAEVQVTVEVIRPNQEAQQMLMRGAGSFIDENLVVTAAHVITAPQIEGATTAITDVTVTGVDTRGQPFLAIGTYNATTSDLREGAGVEPRGADIGVIELESRMDVEVLHLPHELGIGVAEQQELVGSIYGRRIPDRDRIGQAYDRLINADLSFTDDGRGEFVDRPDGERRHLWMPGEIAANGTIPNLSTMSAPFVRMRVPHSPQVLADPWFFVGTLSEDFLLMFGDGREQFVDRAYQAASRFPFHPGDSGSPFISRAPSGEVYLAGVASAVMTDMPNTGDGGGHFTYSFLIATEDLTELLQNSMGRPRGINRDNTTFWTNPHGSVATLDNWDDDTGVRLSALTEAPSWAPTELGSSLCSLNELLNSDFCRYLLSNPTETYSVSPLRVQVNAPNGEFYPYPLNVDYYEYRLYGQAAIYSPENITYNATTPSPIETPIGWAFSTTEHTPFRILPTISERSVIPRPVTRIQADEDNPMICIATPSESGLFARAGAAIARNHTIVSGGQHSCIIADEGSRNSDGTYDIQLEGEGGTITFEVEIKPDTASE